jgi:C1A family cysteine protease
MASCTANAISAAILFNQAKQPNPKAENEWVWPSRLFIYYNERVIEGTTESDAGAQIRDGIKVVAGMGVCKEGDWAYSINNLKRQPDPECYVQAKRELVTSYCRVMPNLTALKACLVAGTPFVFGISIYESFESDQAKQTGLIATPSQSDPLIGGHAMLCKGYDDELQCFLVQNSWGPEWGIKGFCWIPYDYMLSSAMDVWAINAVS